MTPCPDRRSAVVLIELRKIATVAHATGLPASALIEFFPDEIGRLYPIANAMRRREAQIREQQEVQARAAQIANR